MMVLSIPFALSQTRKAIPAGRYEALSGVKTSHGQKSIDSASSKDSVGLFLRDETKILISIQESLMPILNYSLVLKE